MSCFIPAFLFQLILQLHLTVELLLQLVDPFLQVLQLNRKKQATILDGDRSYTFNRSNHYLT